jgi:hypothetical protein
MGTKGAPAIELQTLPSPKPLVPLVHVAMAGSAASRGTGSNCHSRVPTIVAMVPKNKAAPAENNKVEGRAMMSFSMPDSPFVIQVELVFIGYTLDDTLRAFDLKTGQILWETDLPAAGTSVPVTYEVSGEQYVVVPAGGHSMYATTMGDSVVAYKLSH